jgi:IS30 family transposase
MKTPTACWSGPLLRQCFPKSTNLALHSPGYLATVAAALNNRPRAILGDETPAERFAKLLDTDT